jgi:hypothetical protein
MKQSDNKLGKHATLPQTGNLAWHATHPTLHIHDHTPVGGEVDHANGN